MLVLDADIVWLHPIRFFDDAGQSLLNVGAIRRGSFDTDVEQGGKGVSHLIAGLGQPFGEGGSHHY